MSVVVRTSHRSHRSRRVVAKVWTGLCIALSASSATGQIGVVIALGAGASNGSGTQPEVNNAGEARSLPAGTRRTPM